ncbi:DUF1801 domain-containing protein [Croceibacter atlanticus]|jgi:uncharacterized protein YdhG (YjbR/CyaY superfamily)|uniref:DUF1801 domain-containing protein n=1 Tax=Croceibacter atlanticus TaxID=313588 RepID=UPI0032B2B2DC
MKIEANSPDDYISKLPEDRQAAVKKLRDIIKDNLPTGFKETLGYGMLAFVVPLSTYPDGYHCDPKLALPFINIASQKNFVALYHSGIYADKTIHNWFVNEYPKHSKYKLDMGKSCIRFKRMNDIPYELIAELAQKFTVSQWIETYEKAIKK